MTLRNPWHILIWGLALWLMASAHAEPPAAPDPVKPPEKPKPQAPAKPKPQVKQDAATVARAAVMKAYDIDHNKVINLAEAQTMQKAFEKNPDDPVLKKYDVDRNAKLSDAEIMKITPAPPPPKPKAKPAKKPAPKPKAPPKKK